MLFDLIYFMNNYWLLVILLQVWLSQDPILAHHQERQYIDISQVLSQKVHGTKNKLSNTCLKRINNAWLIPKSLFSSNKLSNVGILNALIWFVFISKRYIAASKFSAHCDQNKHPPTLINICSCYPCKWYIVKGLTHQM